MIKKILSIILVLSNSMLSAQPEIEWQKALGGGLGDKVYAVQQTYDEGYILAGGTVSNDGDVSGNHGGLDFWVVKLDDAGAIQWNKTYGGSDNDNAFSIQQTTDGGYVVAGLTFSTDGDVSGNHGDYDAWVIKLDSNGILQWQKALGGSGWEEAWDVQQTNDGGYILVGRTGSTDGDVTGFHGYLDYWVVKLNNIGTIEWQKALGGTSEDLGYSVEQTSDGGYIVAGESRSQDGDIIGNNGGTDYWVLKLNFEGKIEWQKPLGGTSYERANDIHQTRDGGYIVFGESSSNNGDVTGHHGFGDCWAVKLDPSGNIEWQKTLGGSNKEYGRSIYQTRDDGFVLTGTTQSNNGDVLENDGGQDLWAVKLNENGALQWQKTFGGVQAEVGNSVQQTSDGGYILAGQAKSTDGDVSGNHGSDDFWIVKLSPESTPTSAPQSQPLTISPNPATQSITLNIPTETSTLKVRITDLLGRELKQQSVLNNGNLDISTLPNGLYLVTASAPSGQVYAGKLQKKN